MIIPLQPKIGDITINIHLVLEYAAFFIAYRYYVYLRKHTEDPITYSHRLSIILGAAIGAWLGSRLIGYLENPFTVNSWSDVLLLFNAKTIMGGLFGGLLGVEITKHIVGEQHSSGDLLTLPIVVGIFIGRIGCFLSGTTEFTYGSVTSSWTGMNLGDGQLRHPLALYELVFLVPLFFLLRHLYYKKSLKSGMVFQLFMVTYFSFRFVLEFLKPNTFFWLGLSTIQWLCMVCLLYYRRFFIYIFKDAR